MPGGGVGVEFVGKSLMIASAMSGVLLLGGCGHRTADQRVTPPPVPTTQISRVDQLPPPTLTLPTTIPATVPADQLAHAFDFVAAKNGFALKYPAGWQAIKGPEVLDIEQKSFAHRLLTVDVPFIPPHLPGMITLARIEKGFWDDLKKRMSNVQIISSGPQTMVESQARRLKATAMQGDVPMSIDAVVAMRKEHVYILSSETDTPGAADGDAALEMILTSWKWTQ